MLLFTDTGKQVGRAWGLGGQRMISGVEWLDMLSQKDFEEKQDIEKR